MPCTHASRSDCTSGSMTCVRDAFVRRLMVGLGHEPRERVTGAMVIVSGRSGSHLQALRPVQCTCAAAHTAVTPRAPRRRTQVPAVPPPVRR